MKYLFLNKTRRHLKTAAGREGGFTLIELLLVITVIAILSAIAVPLFLGQRSKAIHSEAKTNLESIRLLEEQYFAENGNYGTDGTYEFKVGNTSIQSLLPGFQPGNVDSLNFDYTLEIINSGSQFTATAVGRNGSIVAGAIFSIDQNNNKNF